MSVSSLLKSGVGRVLALAGAFAFLVLAVAAVVTGLGMGTAEAQTSNCPTYSHQPGDSDPEVIIGTTAVRLPTLCGRRGIVIRNRGTSSLWCSVSTSAHARVNRSWEVAAGDAWPVDAKDTNPIWCLSETAQAQGAATILMELR